MKTTDVIRALCKKEGISVTTLEERMGFGNGSLTKNAYPRSDRLFKVAQFFGVSMEYLITGEAPSVSYMSYEEESIIQAYRNANDGIKESVCKLLDVKKDSSLSKEDVYNGAV